LNFVSIHFQITYHHIINEWHYVTDLPILHKRFPNQSLGIAWYKTI